MVTSCSTMRATRRSRKDCEARSMATAAAFSHDSLLVPTRSITLYTLSAMLFSFRSGVRSSSLTVSKVAIATLCIQQQQRERIGDQGRPRFPFDFDGVAGFEQDATLVLRFNCQQHHPVSNACPCFHRCQKAHPLEAIIKRLRNASRDNANFILQGGS